MDRPQAPPPASPHSLQDADVVLHRGRVSRLPVRLEPDHQDVGLHPPQTHGLRRGGTRWGIRLHPPRPPGPWSVTRVGLSAQLRSPPRGKGPRKYTPLSRVLSAWTHHEKGKGPLWPVQAWLATGLSHLSWIIPAPVSLSNYFSKRGLNMGVKLGIFLGHLTHTSLIVLCFFLMFKILFNISRWNSGNKVNHFKVVA